MTTAPAQLLKLLGSGIHPAGATAPATGAASSLFADLLKRAQDGSLASAAPVSVASDADVTCSDDQLARLSLTADKLEAAGVRTALVHIDGQNLLLDVHARQITGAAKDESGVISGIDGVIDLGDARSTSASPAPSATTAAKFASTAALPAQNASLLKLLNDLQTT